MKHVSPVDLCAGNLYLAARAGQTETVATLLENEHVQLTINDHDSDGNTPLYLAARMRSVSTIQVLLDHGADITVRSLNLNSPPEPPMGMDTRFKFEASPGYTPLHGWGIGFLRDRYEFLKGQDMMPTLDLLLQAGCDINAKDYRGRTTLFKWPHLHWADMFTYKFIATLLDRGADATVVDDEGQTPLHCLQSRLYDEGVKLLINAGVDINAQRKQDGLTALMCNALQQNHTDPAIFDELKADFDIQDWEGNTAFHHYFRRSPAGTDCHLNTWLSFTNLQIQNNLGRTPLHEYMYHQGGCVNMEEKKLQPLLEMIERGVSLETKDGLGRTALLIALMGPNGISLDFVEELLRLGANIQAMDYRGRSALHYAVKPFQKQYVSKDETLEVIPCLIKAGANVHAVDYEGNTAFHDVVGHEPTNPYDVWYSIEKRARKAIEMGISHQKANYKGRNALHVAAAMKDDPGYSGNKKVMSRLEFLLQPDMTFDVNAKDNDGVTPLHIASAMSDTHSLILIENGADVQAKDRLGRSPLHYAARAGQSNVVGLLTEIYSRHSLDIEQECTEKRSALHYAAQSGNSEAVQILLQAGANASLADRRGRTSLHVAAEFEVRTHAQRIQTQESMPAAPEPRMGFSISKPRDAFSRMELIVSDEDGARCIQEVIRLLLAAGSNPDQLDANGHRPLDVAVMFDCLPAVDELKLSMGNLPSQSLDPIGESILAFSENRMRDLVESIPIPEDRTRFFERIFSTGNERLAEAFVRNQPMKLDKGENSPLCLLARWGFASMMKRLLPYVEDLGDLVPSLLNHAAKQSLSNLTILGFLMKHMPKSDKTVLSTLLGEFSGGLRWWHPHALSLLLEAGADPNVSLAGGLNPLLISLSPRGDRNGENYRYKWTNESIDILLKHGADPNGIPEKGRSTPLAAAIRGGCSMETIQLLISHGAEINNEKYGLINTAIDLDRHDVLEALLKAGANPNGPSDPPFLVNAAERFGKAEPAMRLLLQYGADPLCLTVDGSSTAFHKLCRRNRPIQLILETSVDLNATDGSGWTPLFSATYSHYWDTNTPQAAIQLIEAGADVHAVDNTRSSALHYAANWGNLPAVQARLNKSVPLSSRNNEGLTPLTTALGSYSVPKSSFREKLCTTINFLLDQGADPLSTLSDGRTALHCIAGILMNYSHKDLHEQIEWDEGEDHFTAASQLYQRFLDAGCDREAKDNEGNTPIFVYATGPKADIRSNEPPPCPSNPEHYKRMFSEHDVHKTNHNGDSLLHAIARRKEWICDADEGEGLFSTLVEMGLSPWKENNSRQTALDIAAAHEKQKILALFARDD